ncbi:putative disease resistance protein RGA3 isoform X1 [Arachis ipaensis]|uniref:putative disease resistance protein RGA3 isoform X1 n=1 Tax=Arachis ipaensis TaxID=130454 RepID=UPI0007AF087A|nr:putative disease resistance protein RGA3 isoform X1 [Arachis ipaensis]XP_020973877.1 putative disease resistance protein RGA3 isoform X1 [Arachis ipaensis]XP_020973878.1 putative disease resistance protein RGA3 isoform X1 [Arachis ipaensis]
MQMHLRILNLIGSSYSKKIEVMTKQKHLLLLTEKLQGEKDQEQQQGSSYLKADVYGREKEKNEMVDYLLSDRSSGTVGNTSVIATVGVEGIGKTTFAEIVYHDNRVKASFELRGWVDYQEEKMGNGIPLTDEERMPWLESLRDATKEHS